MSFKRTKDFIGLIYTPPKTKNKKHPCPDCSFCQNCGEDRCRICRRKKHK